MNIPKILYTIVLLAGPALGSFRPQAALTPKVFLIACPLVFLAGFVDAIGGGGGLISLPAYLLAGLPPHMAIATNKLSSACGTTVATVRFARKGLIDPRFALPAVVCALIGSSIGANLSLMMDEAVMERLLLVVLPVAAFFVLNRSLFKDRETTAPVTGRTWVVIILSALVIGLYDGLYGPGTGTFLIIAFTVFAGMGIGPANGLTKSINLTTNLTSLTIFFLNGQVIFLLGIAAGLCNMLGSYLGSGLAMKRGAAVVRPIILVVLCLLFIKILTGN